MWASSYYDFIFQTLGWQLMNKMASFLYAIGAEFWALAFIFLINWWETSRSQDAGYASVTALKRNQFDFYIAFLVIILFWLPSNVTSIKTDSVRYFNIYTSSFDSNVKQDVTKGVTKITKSFNLKANASDIPIPVGWWLVDRFSKAFSYEVTSFFQIDDTLRRLMSAFSDLKISDPNLRQETNAFYSVCYLPTLSAHFRSSYQPPESKTADLSWIGSEFFVNTPGYYKRCTQTLLQQNKCPMRLPNYMPYTYSDRYGIHTDGDQGDGTPYQRPTCRQWWLGINPNTGVEDNNWGLKNKLKKYIVSKLDWLKGNFSNFSSTTYSAVVEASETVADAAIKRLLMNSKPVVDTSVSRPEQGSVKGWIKDLLAAIGTTIFGFFTSLFANMIQHIFFALQGGMFAVLMLWVPFSMVLSRFSLSNTVSLLWMMFVIISLSIPYGFAHWVDTGLTNFMYQDESAITSKSLQGTLQDTVWIVVCSIFYLIVPAYWLKLLSSIGDGMASGVDGFLSEANKHSDNSSKHGVKGTGAFLNKLNKTEGSGGKK